MFMHFKLDQVIPNRYRDQELNKPNEGKILNLMASYKRTGYWNNCPINLPTDQPVPEGFKDWHDFMERIGTFPKEEQFKIFEGYQAELCYGLHRYLAAQRMGIEEILAPVGIYDKTALLRMMCDENREEWGHSSLTLLESIDKVGILIEETLQVGDFKAYAAAGNTLYTDERSFNRAKNNGVGFKKKHEFLGADWPINSVNAGHVALQLIAAGWYTRENVAEFPSIDTLRTFNPLVQAVVGHEQIPPAIKAAMVKDMVGATIKYKPTGKIMGQATKFFKEGKDPVRFIKDQMPVDIAKTLKARVKAMITEDVDVDTLEGFDNDMMKAIIEKGKKELDAQADREAKEAAKERRIEELMKSGGEDGAELTKEQATAAYEAEVKAESGEAPDSGDSPDGPDLDGLDGGEGGMFDSTPGLESTTTDFGTEALVALVETPAVVNTLADKIQDIEPSEALTAKITELAEAVIRLEINRVGIKALRTQVKAVSDAMSSGK